EEALVETVLSALSAGPVGIGDRLGETDAGLVARCCRADGTIVGPDAPIAAGDRSLRAHAFLTPTPMVAATHVSHDVGRYAYVVSLNVTEPAAPMEVVVSLDDLGEDAPAGGDVVRWDALAERWSRLDDGSWTVRLDHR